MKESYHLVKATLKLGLALSALTLWWPGTPSMAQVAGDDVTHPPPVEGDGSTATRCESASASLSYIPGRGLHIGETGLVLGGYSSIDLVRDEGAPARLTLANVSLFVMFQLSERFSFFSEIEYENLFSIDTNGDAGSPDERFAAERLYVDFSFNDRLEVRAGKFLTPVGRWNVIHAQPLVWTTSRPLVTEVPFDKNTTGVMLSGNLFDGRLGYDLFGQFTDELQAAPHGTRADRSGGARLTLDVAPGLSLGGTYVGFRSRNEWFHLVGIDALWQRGPLEWMTEMTFDEGAGASGSQWGAYTQLAARILPRVYAVGRYEYFAARGANRGLNQVVLGAAFRLRPYAIFKVEYQILDHSSPLTSAGFRSSFALLF